mmetsp:Transcript_14871/g.26261  ORF Transcript_14871/g.26261 Transcript_14871/m.26261 type:complete len:485 (+) Transcript_14871:141-1595(+)
MAFASLSRSPTSFRSVSIYTSLFVKPITFGQLVSSDLSTTMNSPFSTPSCPCCSFLSGAGLFLPWNQDDGLNENDGNNDEVENSSGDLSLSTDIITPNEAWKRISAMGNCAAGTNGETRQQIFLVDTHGHPHLQREVQYADMADTTTSVDELKDSPEGVVSLTCAVSPLDWKDSLKYASQSPQILPALGVHPWYLGDIMVDINDTEICDDDNMDKYLQWEWLTDLETHLSEHPHMLVGEIGLCKMARFVREFPKERGGKATALQLQKLVFRKQLELAAKWSRPVTVHCVNAHGIFMEVMRNILEEVKESCKGEETQEAKKLWRRAFPPAIAMHSFTGTAHHVGEIMAFEKELLYPEEVEAGGKRRRRKQKQQEVENPSSESNSDKDKDGQNEMLFYFGFSHAVNHIMCTSDKARKKGMEAVRSIPPDRLLVESDVHASVDVALGTAGAVAYAAQVRGEMLEEVAECTTRNGLRFLSSLGSLSNT